MRERLVDKMAQSAIRHLVERPVFVHYEGPIGKQLRGLPPDDVVRFVTWHADAVCTAIGSRATFLDIHLLLDDLNEQAEAWAQEEETSHG